MFQDNNVRCTTRNPCYLKYINELHIIGYYIFQNNIFPILFLYYQILWDKLSIVNLPQWLILTYGIIVLKNVIEPLNSFNYSYENVYLFVQHWQSCPLFKLSFQHYYQHWEFHFNIYMHRYIYMYSYACLWTFLYLYMCVYANLRYRGRNSLKIQLYAFLLLWTSLCYLSLVENKGGQKKMQITNMLITLSWWIQGYEPLQVKLLDQIGASNGHLSRTANKICWPECYIFPNMLQMQIFF